MEGGDSTAGGGPSGIGGRGGGGGYGISSWEPWDPLLSVSVAALAATAALARALAARSTGGSIAVTARDIAGRVKPLRVVDNGGLGLLEASLGGGDGPYGFRGAFPATAVVGGGFGKAPFGRGKEAVEALPLLAPGVAAGPGGGFPAVSAVRVEPLEEAAWPLGGCEEGEKAGAGGVEGVAASEGGGCGPAEAADGPAPPSALRCFCSHGGSAGPIGVFSPEEAEGSEAPALSASAPADAAEEAVSGMYCFRQDGDISYTS